MTVEHQTALLVSELSRLKAAKKQKMEISTVPFTPAITIKKIDPDLVCSPSASRKFSLTAQISIDRKESSVSVKSSPSAIQYSSVFDQFMGHPTSQFYSETEDEESTQNVEKPRRKQNKMLLVRNGSRFYTKEDISAPTLIDFPHEMFHPSGMSLDPDVIMEGYLMKRSSNAFKTWNRRWFQIRDNKLLYSHRSAELEQPTVMEENLKLCLVRPAPSSVDRVGCFELVTPTRVHLLQADSEALCNSWMRALQRTILALHESDDVTAKPSSSTNRSDVSADSSGTQKSSTSDTSSVYEQIRRVPGNDKCADCGRCDPKWVSINLGVVVCIECSGVHRSMGVQISKVRSLTMDSIDAELRDLLICLGNKQVNSVYLAYLPETNVIPPEINETSTRQAREAWIKAKYAEKRFAVPQDERARQEALTRQDHLLVKSKYSTASVNRSSSYADMKEANSGCLSDRTPDILPLNKRLSSCGSDPSIAIPHIDDPSWPNISEASRTGDIIVLLQALAKSFDINGLHEGTTALHLAVQNGQTAAVEFLLLNGAKINVLDDRLNTPLHLAAMEGNTLQVCQLLRRGAEKSLQNSSNLTPMDISINRKHADIVTLFRITSMRDEFNEEFDNPMNETLSAVIHDITLKIQKNH